MQHITEKDPCVAFLVFHYSQSPMSSTQYCCEIYQLKEIWHETQ